MAAITGKIGAIYYDSDATITLSTHLQFSSAAWTIKICPKPTTGFGFVNAGFKVGQIVSISGTSVGVSTECEGRKEITTLTSQIMTVSTHAKMGSAGTSSSGVTAIIAETTPGTLMAGFLNWTMNHGADALDITSFDSSGKREYVSGLKNWDATAEKYWLTTGHNPDNWVGSSKKTIRLFVQYTSTPSTATPSLYYEGSAVVTGMSIDVPTDSVIKQSLTFQGDGTLPTITQRTSKWTD